MSKLGIKVLSFGPRVKAPLKFDASGGGIPEKSIRLRSDGKHVVGSSFNQPPSAFVINNDSQTVVQGVAGYQQQPGQAAIALDRNGVIYSNAGTAGTQSVTRHDTFTNVGSVRNIINPPYDVAGLLVIETDNAHPVRTENGKTFFYVRCRWNGGVFVADRRCRGLIIRLDGSDLSEPNAGNAVETLPNNGTSFNTNDIRWWMSPNNDLWFLTPDTSDSTFYLTYFRPDSAIPNASQHLPLLNFGNSNPIGYMHDGIGSILFVMVDDSIQQWAVAGNGTISFVRSLAIAGINRTDTAWIWRRFPAGGDRGGFWVVVSIGGHKCMVRYSSTNLAPLETYDLQTYRAQDSTFYDGSQIIDADYDRNTREMYACFAAGSSRKFQLAKSKRQIFI